MYFDLSKPQKLLQQSVRDFCKREIPISRVRALMETDSAMDDSLWMEMAEQGWIGLHLDEQYGGLGLGPVELSVVAEELGRACVPGPWLSTNWAATLLASIGGPVASELLPGVFDGSTRITIAALEEQGSWSFDPVVMETRLSENGKKTVTEAVTVNVLNGRKYLVQHAQQADHLLCVAGVDDELCLLTIPVASDGLRITSTPGIDATRKVYQCDFSNVPIRRDQILARGDEARQALQQSQNVAMVAVCSEMLGILQWLLKTTVEYAKSRKQFDRVIGSFQVVQHMCADLLLLTESARSAVWNAAWALQENLDANRAVAVAKVYVSDAVRKAGNLAVQSHGGIGFTWEHDLHLYYKRAKADEYLFGDATFHRERLAEMILG